MKVEIRTDSPEQLEENLEKRVESSRTENGKLVVETEEPSVISRTPGVESYTVEGEEREGLGGEPVSEQAYARIESKRDAVRAFIATFMGYDLRVLDTSREWDYRNLKRYNPDMKHLKFEEPREFLEIEYSLFEHEGLEKIEIELDEEEVEQVYREMIS
ncbi:MAG: hypothetical protein ABEJ66_01545 [Candidatus Nanohaloarchaea archaeon]